MTVKHLMVCIVLLLGISQARELSHIPAHIDFSDKILEWDGFGFNYVEAAQSRDYAESPQDYGGFSLLNAEQKQEILELIFGESEIGRAHV